MLKTFLKKYISSGLEKKINSQHTATL